jgi:hypothetical protein
VRALISNVKLAAVPGNVSPKQGEADLKKESVVNGFHADRDHGQG